MHEAICHYDPDLYFPGEGNGTRLQHSCLENPMDGGAWWAAVNGVAQSWTRLKRLHFHFSLLCTGEGNGNPLKCSCLENPRDGGAWWAAVYGITQSRTQLKRLSSSSSSSSFSKRPLMTILQCLACNRCFINFCWINNIFYMRFMFLKMYCFLYNIFWIIFLFPFTWKCS